CSIEVTESTVAHGACDHEVAYGEGGDGWQVLCGMVAKDSGRQWGESSTTRSFEPGSRYRAGTHEARTGAIRRGGGEGQHDAMNWVPRSRRSTLQSFCE